MKPLKLAYLTNNVPAYRSGFFRRLLSDERLDVTVFCHAEVHGDSVELIPEELRGRLSYCRTLSVLDGKLLFELLPFWSILTRYDVIVSDGNPRHAGFAVFSTIAALLRRRVIIWSTLHSRRNRPWTQFARLTWWRVFPEFLSYTEPDAADLRAKFPGRMARSANNGLDQQAIDEAKKLYSTADLLAFKSSLGLEGKQIGLSIGRVLSGRFDLMAEVLKFVCKAKPDFHWMLLGGGDGMASLKQELERHGVSDRVTLAGAIHEESELAKWFEIADVFVYTEAIGLSLYHAFGYGLPVVVHADQQLHGPEMGAFQEGVTGLTFEPGNAQDMAEKILRLLNDEAFRNSMKIKTLSTVREQYNADQMYLRFTRALLEPSAQF